MSPPDNDNRPGLPPHLLNAPILGEVRDGRMTFHDPEALARLRAGVRLVEPAPARPRPALRLVE